MLVVVVVVDHHLNNQFGDEDSHLVIMTDRHESFAWFLHSPASNIIHLSTFSPLSSEYFVVDDENDDDDDKQPTHTIFEDCLIET